LSSIRIVFTLLAISSILNSPHLHSSLIKKKYLCSAAFSSCSYHTQRAARERELEGLASAAASALRAPRAPPPAAGDEDGPMPPSSEPLNTSAATSFAEGLGCANPVFDASGHFVAYTTLTGIKVL
jgi:hypothetical protein